MYLNTYGHSTLTHVRMNSLSLLISLENELLFKLRKDTFTFYDKIIIKFIIKKRKIELEYKSLFFIVIKIYNACLFFEVGIFIYELVTLAIYKLVTIVIYIRI